MRFCDDKDCKADACCNHCKYYIDIKNICSKWEEQTHPLELCDDFECFRIED